MAVNNRFITVVLPLYKPKGDWARQLVNNIRELDRFLLDQTSLQYIVVYDDAADTGLETAFKLITDELGHVCFISYGENRGKGYALREGVKAAGTPYTITLDFDFPYKKENLATLVSLLQTDKCDIVVGRRSDRYFQQVPLKRKIMSKGFSLLNRWLLGLALSDTQSGMKGFNKRGREVFLQTSIDRFLVDTEFVLRGSRQGLAIRAMPIDLRSGVSFSNFGFPVLLTELRNFAGLLLLARAWKNGAGSVKPYAVETLPVR